MNMIEEGQDDRCGWRWWSIMIKLIMTLWLPLESGRQRQWQRLIWKLFLRVVIMITISMIMIMLTLWPPLASDRGRTWRQWRWELLPDYNPETAELLAVHAVFLSRIIMSTVEDKYYCRNTCGQLFLITKKWYFMMTLQKHKWQFPRIVSFQRIVLWFQIEILEAW